MIDKHIPLFMMHKKLYHVEIETTNTCNACCEYCPWPWMDVKPTRMSDETFNKILSELEKYDVRKICLYKSNEPFMDRDIIQRLSLVTNKFPNAIIEISSNFILTNAEKANQLIEVLGSRKEPKNCVWITCSGINNTTYQKLQGGYSKILEETNAKRKQMNIKFENVVKNIITFFEILQTNDTNLNVQLKSYGDSYSHNDYIDFWTHELQKNGIELNTWTKGKILINHGGTDIQSRAGQLKVGYGPKFEKGTNLFGCAKQWMDSRLSFAADGTLTACCHDWKGEGKFPNINEMTLEDIMMSDKVQNFFNLMYSQKAGSNFICSRCEFILSNNV